MVVDGKIIQKPSFDVLETMQVDVQVEKLYVGRAAYKLSNFLVEHPVDIQGKVALDIGASTGGFTQVLLEHEVTQVVAVDVGSDQLHETLRNDDRVQCIEHQDIRTFEHPPFEVVTCDVAFISLHQILPAIDRLSCKDIIVLFKPQFEVGKTIKRNKLGVVQDQKAINIAMSRFEDACHILGWKQNIVTESKIEGKEGNREIFYHYSK